MKKLELIKLLKSFPGNPEVTAVSLDGKESYPIRTAVTWANSTMPEIIRLVTNETGLQKIRKMQYGVLTDGGVLRMMTDDKAQAVKANTGRNEQAVKCLPNGWIATLDGKETGRGWK